MESSMELFILDIIIILLTIITGRGGPRVPCCGLKAKGVDTHFETGNTANDMSWEVKVIILLGSCRENEYLVITYIMY